MNSKMCLISWFLATFVTQTITTSQQLLTPTASFLGTHSYERVGYHVHKAGDVNGDGYDDFLIGTFHNHVEGQDAGAAYLILGRKDVDWGFNVSLASADARFLGDKKYDAVGYCLGGGGDINGDGYDDILIGAPAGNEIVIENPGHVYIVLGKASPDWGDHFVLPQNADASFDGEDQHDLAGLSVAFIGDMNGDGHDDIICGAPYNDYGRTDAGKAYLILGKPDGWTRGINLSQANASFYGTSYGGLVGYSVDGVGDVNGDDVPDIAIGARGECKVFLIFGRQSVDWGFNYHINQADVIFYSTQYNDYTGWRVSRAGDVNADGFDDFLIGAPLYNYHASDNGKVYLILGRIDGWKNDLSQADASYIGEAPSDQAGWDVQDAGDANGDGYDDFLIGAWYNDSNGEDSGKMYLIKGKPSGWQRDVLLSEIDDFFIGEHAGDYLGFSVACAGDVNRDGWSDIIASAPYNNQAREWAGKIYLFTSDRDVYTVSGYVQYYYNSTPIPNISVLIDGQTTHDDTTDQNGNYEFRGLAAGNYVVRPEKENDITSGASISAMDAGYILQYNVGLRTFTPYQLIAGDVSGDGTVSAYDAARILQYRVGLISKFPVMSDSTNFWRFVPEDFPITSANWSTAPDSCCYTPLSCDTSDNYLGMIYGDVTGNWAPAAGELAALGKSAGQTVDIRLENVRGQAGDRVTLPVHIENGSEILALNFTFEYDTSVLKAVGVSQTELTTGWQIAHNIKDGFLKVALAGAAPIAHSGTIIHLTFEVLDTKSPETSSPLTISEISINEGNITANIRAATFTPGILTPAEYGLSQNYPNPFNAETAIHYRITKPGKIELKVYNSLGQIVRTLVDEQKDVGHHEVHWDGTDDAGTKVSSGFYFYQMKAGEFTELKKMLLLM